MDKVKKIMKEFSIFAICLACFCGLFLYRMAVKADISTISESKLVQKIEADESFVVYTSSSSSTTALTYQEVVEKYLTKNRSEKIYFLNLDELDDANTFVSTYFKKDAADLTKEYTYVFINGELYDTKDSALTYYGLDVLMKEFNAAK